MIQENNPPRQVAASPLSELMVVTPMTPTVILAVMAVMVTITVVMVTVIVGLDPHSVVPISLSSTVLVGVTALVVVVVDVIDVVIIVVWDNGVGILGLGFRLRARVRHLISS